VQELVGLADSIWKKGLVILLVEIDGEVDLNTYGVSVWMNPMNKF
jgi:hypothetical protein